MCISNFLGLLLNPLKGIQVVSCWWKQSEILQLIFFVVNLYLLMMID